MNNHLHARSLKDEQGFTLVEMMVTCLIMILVLFALYSIFDMSMRVFSFGNDKVEAVENARLGLEKMEREIRAAYPVDRVNNLQHVFFAPGFPATPARPSQRSITFGNDLPSSGNPPNRKIDSGEAISYELRESQNLNNACPPPPGNEGVCSLVRRQGLGGTFQPVADYVVPGGVTFEYFKSNLTATDVAVPGTDIGVVRIELEVNKDGTGQILTTDVDLRNRG